MYLGSDIEGQHLMPVSSVKKGGKNMPLLPYSIDIHRGTQGVNDGFAVEDTAIVFVGVCCMDGAVSDDADIAVGETFYW